MLADAKTNLADNLCPEALLQLAQNLCLGNLLKLIMQSGLQNPHKQDAPTQANRRGVRGDELADDLLPGIDHFALAQAFAQSELPHQLREQLSGRLPAVRSH